jgi:hypothetical protein
VGTEGAGGEQGRYKDREVDEGEQEDRESDKQDKFYFRGLTPFLLEVKPGLPANEEGGDNRNITKKQ